MKEHQPIEWKQSWRDGQAGLPEIPFRRLISADAPLGTRVEIRVEMRLEALVNVLGPWRASGKS